jgi:hypothetical protein
LPRLSELLRSLAERRTVYVEKYHPAAVCSLAAICHAVLFSAIRCLTPATGEAPIPIAERTLPERGGDG